MERKRIVIKTDEITLSQFLKWAALVTTGGEGKNLIREGGVEVNGEVERRPGRKLHPGDEVRVGGDRSLLIVKKDDVE